MIHADAGKGAVVASNNTVNQTYNTINIGASQINSFIPNIDHRGSGSICVSPRPCLQIYASR